MAMEERGRRDFAEVSRESTRSGRSAYNDAESWDSEATVGVPD